MLPRKRKREILIFKSLRDAWGEGKILCLSCEKNVLALRGESFLKPESHDVALRSIVIWQSHLFNSMAYIRVDFKYICVLWSLTINNEPLCHLWRLHSFLSGVKYCEPVSPFVFIFVLYFRSMSDSFLFLSAVFFST